MKILLCNKFYYRRGGDCIYTMNLEQMLRKAGHEVAIFSQQYPDNEASEWSCYWPSEFKMKPSATMLDSLLRPFGRGSVVRCFEALLDDFRPDVVHLNNIHTQLSPVLAELAHKRGIRVVWTIHDSKLVCPCYTCNRDGRWCEECFTNKHAVVEHRCMPGGLLGAYIGYREALKWTPERLMACVDVLLCPSQFIADILVKGGYRREKICVLSNFIDAEKVKGAKAEKGDYYVYLGRVTAIKGVQTLCRAASALPYRLVVIGGGELLDELKEQYKDCSQIEFRGQLEWPAIRPLLEGATLMVLPAEWSENNPLSVIESLSLGTPVLGAKIGGIPELITPDNGRTFVSGDVDSLKDGIEAMWRQNFDYQAIAEHALATYRAEAYYETLMKKIYEA